MSVAFLPSFGSGRPATEAADLTKLAVRATTARQAGGAGGPGQAPGLPGAASPAVIIDPRTVALAETLRDQPARAEESASDAETRARLRQASENRRFMVEEKEKSVVQMQMQLQVGREQIRLFEETGQVWHTDMHGVLQPDPPSRDYSIYGGAAGYIEGVRKGMDVLEAKLPELIQSAVQMRAEYEASLKR